MMKQGKVGKSWLVTLLLCFFLGNFGAHRFYTAHWKIGVAQFSFFSGWIAWVFMSFYKVIASPSFVISHLYQGRGVVLSLQAFMFLLACFWMLLDFRAISTHQFKDALGRELMK